MISTDAPAGQRPLRALPRQSEPVAALCDTLALAQSVANRLACEGLQPTQLSIVGNGAALPAPPTLDERVKEWGGRGSLWGVLGGLAVGLVLIVPPVGPVVAMGPIATLLISALDGAMLGGGLSAIVAALTGLGLPVDAAQRFEDAVMAQRFLVLVHGPEEDVARARKLIAGMGLAGVRPA